MKSNSFLKLLFFLLVFHPPIVFFFYPFLSSSMGTVSSKKPISQKMPNFELIEFYMFLFIGLFSCATSVTSEYKTRHKILNTVSFSIEHVLYWRVFIFRMYISLTSSTWGYFPSRGIERPRLTHACCYIWLTMRLRRSSRFSRGDTGEGSGCLGCEEAQQRDVRGKRHRGSPRRLAQGNRRFVWY